MARRQHGRSHHSKELESDASGQDEAIASASLRPPTSRSQTSTSSKSTDTSRHILGTTDTGTSRPRKKRVIIDSDDSDQDEAVASASVSLRSQTSTLSNPTDSSCHTLDTADTGRSRPRKKRIIIDSDDSDQDEAHEPTNTSCYSLDTRDTSRISASTAATTAELDFSTLTDELKIIYSHDMGKDSKQKLDEALAYHVDFNSLELEDSELPEDFAVLPEDSAELPEDSEDVAEPSTRASVNSNRKGYKETLLARNAKRSKPRLMSRGHQLPAQIDNAFAEITAAAGRFTR